MNTTVKSIVTKYLKDNGYDGLANENGECACLISDLMPCDCECGDCYAGYKFVPAEDEDQDFDWGIQGDKP